MHTKREHNPGRSFLSTYQQGTLETVKQRGKEKSMMCVYMLNIATEALDI